MRLPRLPAEHAAQQLQDLPQPPRHVGRAADLERSCEMDDDVKARPRWVIQY
jgi:hypothetical protein